MEGGDTYRITNLSFDGRKDANDGDNERKGRKKTGNSKNIYK
jgi:hypothetical protein